MTHMRFDGDDDEQTPRQIEAKRAEAATREEQLRLAQARADHDKREAAGAVQKQRSALQTALELGAELAQRGPVEGRSAWRLRAESLLELAHHVLPIKRRIMDWASLQSAVPAHLLVLAQELHHREAARATESSRGVARRPIDIEASEVFALESIWTALEPLAAAAASELLPSARDFDSLVHEVRAAAAAKKLSGARDVYAGFMRPEQVAREEQDERNLAYQHIAACARLIAHPLFAGSSWGRSGALPE